MKYTAALIKLPGATDPLHNLTNSMDPFPKVILGHGPPWLRIHTTVPDKQILLNIGNIQHDFSFLLLTYNRSGFGGLEVSVLAFGTRVRGFKPGRSRRIFRAKKSSARLPS